MFKKLFFISIGFLFFASIVFAEDFSTSLRTSSAVYKKGYIDVPFLDSKAEYFSGYFISRISARDNYLFVLGVEPSTGELFEYKPPNNLKEDGYTFFDIIDLRNSETVFSNGYLFKEYDVSSFNFGLSLLKNKYLTVADNYAFIGLVPFTGLSINKIYDISNLPEVIDKGFIDIFPNAVSKNKAFVISEKEISIYDITDVNYPILKGKYLKSSISQIKIEGNRAYIEYYDADKKENLLEILEIKDFSFKKIGKSYPLPLSSDIYFQSLPINFFVRNKFIYILDSVEGTFVLDVSNPNNIHKISSIKGVAGPDSIINNNYAFIYNHPSVILNISNPHSISIALRILELEHFPVFGSNTAASENYLTLNRVQNNGQQAGLDNIAASSKYLILSQSNFVGPYEPPAGQDLFLFELPSFKVKLNKFNSNVEIKKSPKVILTWQTNSEDRAEKFCIMRKNMNINKKIGCVNAKGTVSQGASYRLVDSTVKNEKTYKYRLLYKDIGGEDHFLKVISVRVN